MVAVDSRGNFYLTWVGFVRGAAMNVSDMHVYVSKLGSGDSHGSGAEKLAALLIDFFHGGVPRTFTCCWVRCG